MLGYTKSGSVEMVSVRRRNQQPQTIGDHGGMSEIEKTREEFCSLIVVVMMCRRSCDGTDLATGAKIILSASSSPVLQHRALKIINTDKKTSLTGKNRTDDREKRDPFSMRISRLNSYSVQTTESSRRIQMRHNTTSTP